MPSDLPIVTPDPSPSPRGQAEKYGGLFYLGIAGLVVLVALIAWFAAGVWNLRSVLRSTYILYDPARDEAARIQAALDLSRNPRATQRQYWDAALSRDLPAPARYLMAESLDAGIVAEDPRGFALAVARSRGWPPFLRLLAVRALACAADKGLAIPRGELKDLLRAEQDPIVRLWVVYAMRAMNQEDGPGLGEDRRLLEATAREGGPRAELAALLLAALRERGAERDALLDRATRWLRDHHPEAVRIWSGWELRDGEVYRRAER
jgi:hypothetical protein